MAAYVTALGLELRRRTESRHLSRPFTTVYVGGGTPTLLPVRELSRLGCLLGDLRRYGLLDPGAEITIEANPGTLDAEKLNAIRSAGFNRLSLGLAVWQDSLKTRLGRTHTTGDFLAALFYAREAGMENINVDILYGVPGQRLADWEETLAGVVALNPEGISAYGLEIEAGTPLYAQRSAGKLVLPEEDEELAMFLITAETLAAAGYVHYEISNFARPGYECRHNLGYWQNGHYLGIGAGAHSHLPGLRLVNIADPDQYTATVTQGDLPTALETPLTEAQSMSETVLMGLRLRRGVDRQGFRARFGRNLDDVYGPQIARLTREGLLEGEGGRVRLTARGLPVANVAFVEFV